MSIFTPKLRRFQWSFIVGAFLCLNIAIYVFGHVFGRQRDASELLTPETEGIERLPYDHQIATLPKNILQHTNQNWRLMLVTFINATTPTNKLYYLNTLSRQYRDHGLEVVIAHTGALNRGDEIKAQFKLSLPVIRDEDLALKRLFHITSTQRNEGLALLTSDNRVKFSDPFIPEEDQLRILVEKHLLTQPDYSFYEPQPHAFFQKGRSIPDLKVEKLDDGSEALFDGKSLANKSIALFLAGCSTCKLAEYANQLSRLEKDMGSGRIIAIFPSSFPIDKLKDQIRNQGINAQVYILRSGASQLHDESATRFRLAESGPLLVRFNGDGAVAAVTPLVKN